MSGHVLLISEGQHGAAPATAVTDTARQIGEELADALAGQADHFPDLAQGFAFRTERLDEYETFGLLGRHHFCMALFGDKSVPDSRFSHANLPLFPDHGRE